MTAHDDLLAARADWIYRQQTYLKNPHTITADEGRCLEVLCALGQPYNLPVNWERIRWMGNGLSTRYASELATYDGAELTALVIAAHTHAVRVSVRAAPGGNRPAVRIQLNARQPSAPGLSLFERHPTLAQAIAARA